MPSRDGARFLFFVDLAADGTAHGLPSPAPGELNLCEFVLTYCQTKHVESMSLVYCSVYVQVSDD